MKKQTVYILSQCSRAALFHEGGIEEERILKVFFSKRKGKSVKNILEKHNPHKEYSLITKTISDSNTASDHSEYKFTRGKWRKVQ